MRDENRISLLCVVLTLAFPRVVNEKKQFLVSFVGNGIFVSIIRREETMSTGSTSTSICFVFSLP